VSDAYIASEPPYRDWPPVSGDHGAPVGVGLPEEALAEMVTAPADAVAERARKALLPVLPHTALVLVTPGSPTFPVQIAAPRAARQGLLGIDWTPMVSADPPAADGGAARLALPDMLGGLRVVGWVARSSGFIAALIVGDHLRMSITPDQERAALRVAMAAAARVRAIDHDPPPGTLAFSRAMSQERDRIRLELRGRHASTLSSLLLSLRSASAGGSQATPPGVAKAIDLASRALLDLQADSDTTAASGRAALGAAFTDIEKEVSSIAGAAQIQLVADLDADDSAQVAYAVAHAARLITRGAALNAIQRPGADKVRLRWRLTDQALLITIADNAVGADHAAPGLDRGLSDIRRLAAELRGRVDLDVNPQWGTTLSCVLPLHDLAPAPETPATRRLAELRDREREVLELMIAGLRNRDIAARLFISERTVKFHVSNILAKLQVGSRTEAIAVAHGAGLSPISGNGGA
jgi:DNA-binding CsgD family transcriptional regulator/signal transduction histidine kinase